ncbi:MAG: hypothetical protein K2J36_03825, partial [Ruminococcus sp.]|nr:hypothetical protein [Ruminococcus sp.]
VMAVLILSLVLPINAEISFIDGILKYRLKFSLIPLADSDGYGLLKKRKKRKKPAPETEEFEDFPEEDDDDTDYYEDPEEDSLNEEEEEEDSDIDIDIDIPIVEDFEEYEENLSGEEETEYPEDIHDTETEKEEHEEKSLTDRIEFLINIWDIAGRPLLKIFRGFHIKKVYIDFIVAGDDPYKCALLYGTVSGTVYNLLAWLGELFTVSYKTVDIRCSFNKQKSQWNSSCKVNFRLYTLVFSILWFLTVYLFRIYIPEKHGRKKSGK